MHKSYKLLGLVLVVVLMFGAASFKATRAQDEGGVIVEGNFGGDPKNLNPLLVGDTASQRIATLIYPGLVGVDPKTGNFTQPGTAKDQLATGWTISKDNLTYTFTLRKDAKWSDGTPITAKDFKFSYDAIVSGKVESPLTGPTQERIANVEAPDDYTVVVTFKQPSCQALADVGFIVPVPSHVFKTDYSDMAPDSPFNTNPSVSAGPFKFKEFRPGEQVALVRDPLYPDGKVVPEGFIYKNVPDQTVLVEQFLAGATNFIDNAPVGRRADLHSSENVQSYDFPGNAWDYIAWNLGDPGNPVSAVDEKGNLTNADQGHHPLFGDVRVRRALALGTNVDQMIKTAVFGEGSRLASYSIPSSWATDKDLKPLPYDPDAAAKMLDEAGFPKGPDGIRVAKGAKYAQDGTPFKFVLYTNEGNSRRAAAGTVFQDNMKQLGIVVDFQPIEFNTILDKLNQQNFDAILLGWRNSYPDDPDQIAQIFVPNADIVGSGNNSISYNNPEFTKLQQEANSIPGCDQAKRTELYKRLQKILQDDQPYMFLYVINGYYGARKGVENFKPYPSNWYWNVNEWKVTPAAAAK